MLAVRDLSPEEAARVVRGVNVPDIELSEVLVRVDAASLCGSDLEVLTGESPSRFE